MFFYFWKVVIKNIVPNTFFALWVYFKYVFSKHFLNHSFHIILNNNTQTLLCKIQTTPNFTLEFIISFNKKLF